MVPPAGHTPSPYPLISGSGDLGSGRPYAGGSGPGASARLLWGKLAFRVYDHPRQGGKSDIRLTSYALARQAGEPAAGRRAVPPGLRFNPSAWPLHKGLSLLGRSVSLALQGPGSEILLTLYLTVSPVWCTVGVVKRLTGVTARSPLTQDKEGKGL